MKRGGIHHLELDRLKLFLKWTPHLVPHRLEIQNLRILLQEVGAAELEPIQLAPGTAVEVTRGPFKGVIGTAVQVLNTLRVIIEIRQLGVAFSVNVPKSFVKTL